MRIISKLAVALIVGSTLFCVVDHSFGRAQKPAGQAPKQSEILAMPDVPQPAATEAFQQLRRKEPPKDEGLHKLGGTPKRFVIGAGSLILTIIWRVFLILALIVVLFTAVLYVRKRMGGEDRGVETLARAFDEAVNRVRAKRKQLQSQVNVLAKREGALAPQKKSVAKPRKKVVRAKKSS